MSKLHVIKNTHSKETADSLRALAILADDGKIDGATVIGVSRSGTHRIWLSGRCRHILGVALTAVATAFHAILSGDSA